MGLPGKFPTRWQVTTDFPSFSSHAKGSHVYLVPGIKRVPPA